MLILAASIPVCVVTAGFVGILAAKQRFDLITWVRIPTGALAYLSPIAVLPFSKSLVMVTAVLFLIRVITLLINLVQCLLVLPVLRVSFRIKRAVMRPLLSLGGWMTVTNVVSPLMVSLDRFFIGAIISVSAVAYYTTPFEAVTKLWTIPFSLTGVLFPAFAVSFLTDANRASKLFARGVKYIFLCLFPIILLIVTFSHEGLNLWLGEEFAQNSTRVLQLLAIGVLINSLAHIPFSYIQSAGRPDLTAKLHLVEFAPVPGGRLVGGRRLRACGSRPGLDDQDHGGRGGHVPDFENVLEAGPDDRTEHDIDRRRQSSCLCLRHVAFEYSAESGHAGHVFNGLHCRRLIHHLRSERKGHGAKAAQDHTCPEMIFCR